MQHPLFAFLLLTMSLQACASDEFVTEQCSPMTAARLGELIKRIDHEAKHSGSTWEFGLESFIVAVVYDEAADRMRILIPIRSIADMGQEELMRVMQANFDSALDARYAVARNVLWGAFVHPLSTLSDEEFLTAVGETANIVATYGTSYSSGVFIFGGGDSGELQRRELIDRLRGLGTST